MPGRIGVVGHDGLVHPHEEIQDVTTSGADPIFEILIVRIPFDLR